jgi:hypothetical protein
MVDLIVYLMVHLMVYLMVDLMVYLMVYLMVDLMIYQMVDPSGLRRGFESRRGHRCLSLVNVICCQIEVTASG